MLSIFYSVFILSCSVPNPTECSKQYIGDIQTSTPMGCIMGSQPYMRKWIENHAGLRTFKKLRCVDSRRKDHEMGRDQA